MAIALFAAVLVGASEATPASDIIEPGLRDSLLWLIATAGFVGSLLGAGAAAVASWTVMKMQSTQNAQAIERVAIATRSVRDQVQGLSREVSELRGYVEGRER